MRKSPPEMWLLHASESWLPLTLRATCPSYMCVDLVFWWGLKYADCTLRIIRPASKILTPIHGRQLCLLYDTHSQTPPDPSMRSFLLSLLISSLLWPTRISYVCLWTFQLYLLTCVYSSHQVVRRLTLSALNSAARAKPHLVRDHLVALLPNLYKETIVDPTLIRTVQMGPWSHKVDDGLDTRKTAYETMYTLV